MAIELDGKSILAIDAHSQSTHYWRGIAYYKKGCPDKAIDDLNHCLQMKSEGSPAGLVLDAYITRAHARQLLGNQEDAIDDLTEELGRKPATSGFRDRAQSYCALGNYAGALSVWDQVIRLDPTPDDYPWRGWTDLNLGGSDQNAQLTSHTTPASVREPGHWSRGSVSRDSARGTAG